MAEFSKFLYGSGEISGETVFADGTKIEACANKYTIFPSILQRSWRTGYESEENYHYLDGKEQLSYIKPANYEMAKTQKYHGDIGRSW